jgi:hypothetical protein
MPGARTPFKSVDWNAEILRRLAAIKAGTAPTISGAEMLLQIAKRLSKNKSRRQ